ncbi:MAG: carbohydrate ABC transporter permease [Caldicoprobacterales bacterium]
MSLKRKSTGEKIFDVFNHAILVAVATICLYPMIYVLFASFSKPSLLAKHRGILFYPLGFTLKGYQLVLENPNIASGYFNTIIYVVVGTGLSLLLTAFGAYALSRKDLLWKKQIMVLITFTMFFSGGLIPFYLVVMQLKLINTRWAVILPSLISVWNLIVMRTSFQSIPESLIESAKIDGANDFTVLFRIVIPVSGATMAVMTLFYAVGQWNSWFNAMIFLRDRDLFPLQLILREILISNDANAMIRVQDASQLVDTDFYKMLVKYCTIIVSTAPILCLYPFLQKYFVKGVMIGSLKE